MNLNLTLGHYGFHAWYIDLSNYPNLKSFQMLTFRIGKHMFEYMTDDGFDNRGWKYKKLDIN